MNSNRSQVSQRSRTLWVVSELYYPEETSTGYFLTRIAEGLSGHGEVRVVCGQPTYSEHGLRADARETRRGVQIARMRSTRFRKDHLALRALNFVTFTSAAGWYLLRHLRRGDRVLVVTNPPGLPLAVSLAARVRRASKFLLVHDVYPEVLAATGLLRPEGFVYRLLHHLMIRTFRSFDKVIVLGRDMQQLIADKTGLPLERLPIIPNWGDVEEIVPVPRSKNGFAGDLGIDSHTVIQFSGNIGRTHDIETILEVARRMKERDDLIFLFVGYGGKTHLLTRAVQEEHLPNVRFEPRQPRSRLAEMLSCADATIIAFAPNMLGLSVPSRMYNVLAAGTPIIAMAAPSSELSLMVAENRAGWVVPPGDVDELERVVHAITVRTEALSPAERGSNGRASLVPSYTLDHVLDQYNTLLQEPDRHPR